MEDKKPRGKRKLLLSESEKKRRRALLVKKRNSERIQIGDQFVRWRYLREEKKLKTDKMTAKFLLDRYKTNAYSKRETTAGLPAYNDSSAARRDSTIMPMLSTARLPNSGHLSTMSTGSTKISTYSKARSPASEDFSSLCTGSTEVQMSSTAGLPASGDLTTTCTGSPIISDRHAMESMYTGTMDDAQIKTEPLDTFDTVDTPRNLNTDNVKPEPAFMENSPQAKPREPEGLLMDCESDHDIGSDGIPDGNNQPRFIKNIQPKKNSNSALVDVKSIRGLPVNKPFRIKYSSSIVGSVESKVYIIVECLEVGVAPVMIDVEGVHEMPSERFNSNVLQAHSKSRHVDVPNKEGFNDSYPQDCYQSETETGESDNEGFSESFPGHSYDSETETGESDTNILEFEEEMDEKTHMVSGILDELIGAVVKQYKIHPDYGCEQSTGTEGGENKMSKKRKGSRDFMSFKKEQKIIKLDDSKYNTDVSHSSRIRSKGYRINYADLNEFDSFSDTSDLEDVLTDSSDVNDNLEGIENKSSINKSKRRVKKNEDPDFLPEGSKEQESDVLSSTGDVNEDIIDDPDEERNKKKKTVRRRDSLKKCQRKKREWQTVTLSEHPEKYYIEDQVSVQMKDRGKSDSEKTSKLMVCAECHKFRTKDRSLMETHLEYHLNGDFSCKKCEFKAAGINEMRKHTNEHHISMKKKKIFCLLCEDRFAEKGLYQNHLTTVHNLLPYLCSICSTKDSPVTFRTAQIYKEHYVEKHKERMHQCSYCGLYQISRHALRYHVCTGKTEVDRDIPCDICGKEMRHDSLGYHKRRVHFNVRPFPCPECKYAASQAIKLQQHIQAKHAGIHNHKCDLCDFTCVRPAQLVSHQRTHTGYKPYKCDQCPYAAAWNVQLKDHKKLHGNALGKECKLCGVLIRTGAPYTKHMRKEHNAGDTQ